ncbi:hypothetical protein OIDMADRAFT_59600 [Oidiodendron maius Zn]|uniref:Uncharacterized protein n=1 Tax=Oidiodendron maius (strain Zn) TaxID=913774 RepID=A0A0C3CS30_OIDMZ|nr:hypothetical protein OIDMADRAFT_62546 [Oidiodendron maius Zn]KIM92505.1 hypothetical protein OIDMADRAFT_62524 [Oidiodendron maius Zn]KIM95820.1 hypothetical protein OIDMADRAFT_59600 [Oidiodendron maius Zn]
MVAEGAKRGFVVILVKNLGTGHPRYRPALSSRVRVAVYSLARLEGLEDP